MGTRMKSPQHLSAAIDEYTLYRSIATSSAYQMRRSISLFSEFLGRDATRADLTDREVSLWLAAMQSAAALAETTIAGHRTKLMCLWRFESDRGHVPPPHRVREAKRPEPSPISWTLDELRSVIAACGKLDGRFRNGVGRALYCSTLVKFCYETGLRRSDVWRIERRQIRPDGSIVMRQRKTGAVHYPRIRSDTCDGISVLPGDRPLACPYKSTGDWYTFWRKHVIEPAGVRVGALQQIRRTGATHLAIEHPDAVQRYLGHRTASMQRHYVDQSIAKPQQHMPPEISEQRAATA
jgi:integrase